MPISCLQQKRDGLEKHPNQVRYRWLWQQLYCNTVSGKKTQTNQSTNQKNPKPTTKLTNDQIHTVNKER